METDSCEYFENVDDLEKWFYECPHKRFLGAWENVFFMLKHHADNLSEDEVDRLREIRKRAKEINVAHML